MGYVSINLLLLGLKKGNDMICPHCGRYLEDGVAFCIYCGQRLGKYASGDAAEPSQAVNLGDAPADAFEVDEPRETAAAPTGAYAAAAGAAAAGAAGAAAATAAAAPVAPASAQDAPRPSVRGGSRESSRLHPDDEIARRMNELGEEPSTGTGKKVLGGVILAALAAAAIGLGASYVVPGIMNGDGGGASSAAQVATTSSSADDSSSSSKSTSSSKSSKSSKSGASADSSKDGSDADTKRGSTLERANSDDASATSASGAPETVEARPTTGEETTTGIVNTYTPAPTTQGFSGATATATSVSPTEGSVSHGPELVLDGKPETAWNTNMNGVGQSITISVNDLSEVNGLKIRNGYNKKSASGTDLYYANARAKKILIEYATGSFEYTLKDKKRKYQNIPFKDPQPTSWMKITILSVYPGDKYDDCCISDIKVY